MPSFKTNKTKTNSDINSGNLVPSKSQQLTKTSKASPKLTQQNSALLEPEYQQYLNTVKGIQIKKDDKTLNADILKAIQALDKFIHAYKKIDNSKRKLIQSVLQREFMLKQSNEKSYVS